MAHLDDCPLGLDQHFDDCENEDNGYEARFMVTVTPSEQLWHWLAGGRIIKVIGPPEVAELLAQRAAAAAAVYEDKADAGYLSRVDHGHEGFVSRPCAH